MKSRCRMRAPFRNAARSGAERPPPIRVHRGAPPKSSTWRRTASIGSAASAPIAQPKLSRMRIFSAWRAASDRSLQLARWTKSASSSASVIGASPLSIARDAAPAALHAPEAGPQALQLYDLAVVNEQVDLWAPCLDVPLEHLGVGRLEHQFVQADPLGDLADDVGPPSLDVLGEALRFHHDDVRARFEAGLGAADHPTGVSHALGPQFSGRRGAARTELHSQFRLGLQP